MTPIIIMYIIQVLICILYLAENVRAINRLKSSENTNHKIYYRSELELALFIKRNMFIPYFWVVIVIITGIKKARTLLKDIKDIES